MFIEFEKETKLLIARICIYVLIFYLLTSLLYAFFISKVRLSINNSILEIGIGDIFNEKSYKVIAFNEFFDTSFENDLISPNTLNGKYLKTNYDSMEKVKKLNEIIARDNALSKSILDENVTRTDVGKTTRYKLGAIYKDEKYFLTAFSKFDEDNKAYLYMTDYVSFFMNFWNEVDRLYGGETVSLPLLGFGMTRTKDFMDVSPQELIEIIVWTFKISRVKFKHPSMIKIVILPEDAKRINFYELKEMG